MGIKRIIIAVSVIVIVLGLTVLLLFQTGVDEKVVAALLPKLENRFGLIVKYGSIDASLTSISLDDVSVSERSTGCVLAKAEEINVNVRVGPLFFGKVDLTGVRIKDIELRIGEQAGGCDYKILADLLKKTRNKSNADLDGNGTPSITRPEIQLKSAKILGDDGFIAFSLSGISGRIGPDNRTILQGGEYRLYSNRTSFVRGGDLKIDYSPDNKQISIAAAQPNIDLVVGRAPLMTLVRNFRASADQLEELSSAPSASSVGANHPQRDRYGLSWHVEGGACTLIDPNHPNKRVIVKDIVVDATLTGLADITLNSTGRLPGTDAEFSLSLKSNDQGPQLSLKIPDVGLSHFSDFLGSSPHVNWNNASMDGDFHATLNNDSKEIELSGQTVLTGLTIHHERLSDETIRNLDMNADFKLRYSPQTNMLHLERLLISRKLARFTLRGDINTARLAFNLQMNIPPTACRHIREAIPDALVPKLKNAVFEGTFSADLGLELDSESPEDVKFAPVINNQCRFRKFGNVPEPDYFRGPFTYVAYTADKEPIRLVSGPGTDRWTPYREISSFLIDTVLTTEDGKFWHHAGITAPEIRRAIALNLKKESLRHGASTITMQLAKNLLLDRARTISRKLQEIVLVWYLESYFSKEELLELYFNVVEFGPSIYGIRDASLHYFGRAPYDLNLVESVYLVKLLPNPPVRHRSYERGKVGEKQLKMLRRVMKTMHDRKRLTDSELAEGLSQEIVFHKDGFPLPEPRIRTALLNSK